MCWACEEEQMLAAYRDYLARRKAALAAAGAAPTEATPPAAEPKDWAAGTWFAALADKQADEPKA